MKVEYINPFIESVYDLFSNMLNCEAKRGEIGVSREIPPSRDLVALIGLSGPAKGIVALSFPVSTALAMVSKMLGNEMRIVDETVKDAMAEMINIIAGGAKARLSSGEGDIIHLSLPTVVRGNSYKVDYPTLTAWLDVSFESDVGPFHLRVAIEMSDEETEVNHESVNS